MEELTVKNTEFIKLLWFDMQKRNFNRTQYDKMNNKKWVSLKSIKNMLTNPNITDKQLISMLDNLEE